MDSPPVTPEWFTYLSQTPRRAARSRIPLRQALCGKREHLQTPSKLAIGIQPKRLPLRHVLPSEDAGIVPVKLFDSKAIGDWSQKEVEMLVEFIVLMGDGERWPSHKRMYYLILLTVVKM